uniref:alkaline phosphatase n=1 Tax=Timema monikensis TaxID=170555 RepID=A0A7R9HMX0_9NEOP|nr:unnamed protein product [Timema monikensis]
MSFELDRKLSTEDEPSLSEMVTTAIRLLRRNSRGFLLVVEAVKKIVRTHFYGHMAQGATLTVDYTAGDGETVLSGTRDSYNCYFTIVLEEEAPITGNNYNPALPNLIYIRRKNDHGKQMNDNAVAQ